MSRPSTNVIAAATASGAGVPYREYGERVVGSGSGACPDGWDRGSLTLGAYSSRSCDQGDDRGGLSSWPGVATIESVRRSRTPRAVRTTTTHPASHPEMPGHDSERVHK